MYLICIVVVNCEEAMCESFLNQLYLLSVCVCCSYMLLDSGSIVNLCKYVGRSLNLSKSCFQALLAYFMSIYFGQYFSLYPCVDSHMEGIELGHCIVWYFIQGREKQHKLQIHSDILFGYCKVILKLKSYFDHESFVYDNQTYIILLCEKLMAQFSCSRSLTQVLQDFFCNNCLEHI